MNGFNEYKQLGKIINPIITSIHNLSLEWCKIVPLNECDQKYNPKGWVSENYLGFSRVISILYNPVQTMMEIKDGNNVNNFEGVVITLHIMLCMLFSENDYEYVALDNTIKIFLTIIHKFKRNTFLLNGKKPIWLQKPNFISLLNLPDQIKKFGNI